MAFPVSPGDEITRADLIALADHANLLLPSIEGKPFAVTPPIYVAISQAEMLRCGYADDGLLTSPDPTGGTTRNVGGIVIRTDLQKAFQLINPNYKSVASWKQLTNWFVQPNLTSPSQAVAVPTSPPTGPDQVFIQTYGRIIATPWYRARYDKDGTLFWARNLGTGSWLPELNRIRATILGAANHRREITISGERYYTTVPLSGYTQEKYTIPLSPAGGDTPQNSIKLGAPYYWTEGSYAFPDSIGGQSVSTVTHFFVLEHSDNPRLEEKRLKIKIDSASSVHLTGTLIFRFPSPFPLDVSTADVAVIDDGGLIASIDKQTNGWGPWTIHLDASVGSGVYEIKFINNNTLADLVPPWSGDVDISLLGDIYITSTYSTKTPLKGIHSSQTVSSISFSDPPRLYFQTDGSIFAGVAAGDIWADAFVTHVATAAGPGGYFYAKPFAISAANADPYRAGSNLVPHFILAPFARAAIPQVPTATANQYQPPRAFFRRQPNTVKLQTPAGTILPGATISRVYVARKSSGDPRVFVRGTALTVRLGCIRAGAFIELGSVTIPANQRFAPVLSPAWIDFTSDGLAYDCSEEVDIQAMICGNSIQTSTQTIYPNIVGPWATTNNENAVNRGVLQVDNFSLASPDHGPVLSHFFNDTWRLIDFAAGTP